MNAKSGICISWCGLIVNAKNGVCISVRGLIMNAKSGVCIILFGFVMTAKSGVCISLCGGTPGLERRVVKSGLPKDHSHELMLNLGFLASWF